VGLNNHRVLINRNGTRRLVTDSCAPIRDKKDNMVGAVLVFRDITEQKKLEGELLKVQKLESIGVLAGGIAHDFNNILTGILGNVSLAKMQLNPSSPLYDTLNKAENASLRARDLTRQLLTFARGGNPIKEAASLKELIAKSVGFAIRGSNVLPKIDIADDLWPAEIDSGQINQVLNNLIINADQAMPEGGMLTVTAKKHNPNGAREPASAGGKLYKNRRSR